MTSATVSAALAMSGLVPFEAKLLLAHVLDRDRAWLASHRDAPLTREQALAFDALARRRRDGEPVAYLTGRREFFGLDLEITRDVLIPRPETELLVELSLTWLGEDAPARVLDLGSGSGAVALAVASQRPRTSVVGADVSAAAIALARRNAERLAITNATFLESDWFARVPPERFALIVANPPYVAEEDAHLGQRRPALRTGDCAHLRQRRARRDARHRRDGTGVPRAWRRRSLSSTATIKLPRCKRCCA